MRLVVLLIIATFLSCNSDKPSTSKTSEAQANSAQKAAPQNAKQASSTKQQAISSEAKASSSKLSSSKAKASSSDAKMKESSNSKLKSSNSQKVNEKNTTKKVGKVETNFNSEGIPDACDLMTVETIGKVLNIDPKSINLADGSSRNSQLQRACFFKWDGSEIKNAGVMVQLQKNPVADDVPEYFTYMIQSKKTDGENDFTNSNLMKYKDWPGFGDDGAYSTEAGKYIWRLGNDWAFMIAFNTVHNEKTQKKAAEALAKEVMSRMTF